MHDTIIRSYSYEKKNRVGKLILKYASLFENPEWAFFHHRRIEGKRCPVKIFQPRSLNGKDNETVFNVVSRI